MSTWEAIVKVPVGASEAHRRRLLRHGLDTVMIELAIAGLTEAELEQAAEEALEAGRAELEVRP